MADQTDIGSALPDYEVEREIGRGGMGVVFLGHHIRLGRRVAIKELPPSFATDASVRERFSTEARTLAALTHPHIVPVYDYVEREGLCLIVMEELPGGTVWERFTSAGLTPPTACAIALACCAALQHAHSNGVLHLDVKPDNLMFAGNEAVKVTDFGISRVIAGGHTLGTVDGQVLGTPAYMSPEQARGADLSARSDVYSTGVMLYELLSGHLPWTGAETANDLLMQRLREDPRPLQSVAPQVPEGLAAVVMKAIAREPADRYATAEELGVAVASACAAAWGPSWLDFAGVALTGSERLTIAARTSGHQPVAVDLTTTGPSATAAPPTTMGDAVAAPPTTMGEAVAAPPTTFGGAVAAPRASETVSTSAPATTASAPVAPAPSPGPAAPPAAPPQFAVVRAAGSEPRIAGADANALGRDAFVDVARAIDKPTSPRLALLLAALLLVAAVVVAIATASTPARSGNVRAGQVRVGATDLAAPGTLHLDTAKDVPVVVARPLGTLSSRATMQLSVAGTKVATMSADLVGGRGTFRTNALRYLASGTVEGRLEVRGGDKVLLHETVPVRVARPWYLTGFGIGSVLLILAGIAYLESAIRPLRRGRRRVLAYAGLAVSAAVTAAGAVALATAIGALQPVRSGIAVACVLAAGAGVAWGVATRRSALRKGIRRAVKRAERAYAVAG